LKIPKSLSILRGRDIVEQELLILLEHLRSSSSYRHVTCSRHDIHCNWKFSQLVLNNNQSTLAWVMIWTWWQYIVKCRHSEQTILCFYSPS
jgi:hypothetical protein